MFHFVLATLFLLASPGLQSAQIRQRPAKTPINIRQIASEIKVEALQGDEIVVHANNKPPKAIMQELNKNLDPKPTPTALEKKLEPVGHALGWVSRILGVVVLVSVALGLSLPR